MNERELGKAMAEQDRGHDQALVERLIRRDRWLTRTMTALTVGLWVLSAGLVLALYWMVIVWVMPVVRHVATQPPGTVDAREAWDRIWMFGMRIGWPMTIAATVLMILAAISTVLLVHWSRRATLRLVDQRLGQILAELRRHELGKQP